MKRPLFHCAIVLVCAVAFNALWAVLPFHVLANNALPRRPHIAHIGSDSATAGSSTSDSGCPMAVPCARMPNDWFVGCGEETARVCVPTISDMVRVCTADGYPTSVASPSPDDSSISCDGGEIPSSQFCQEATSNENEQIAYDNGPILKTLYCFL